MTEGIRAPNLPLRTDLSEFIGIHTDGSQKSLGRFTRAEVIGGIEAVANSFTVGGGVIFTTPSQALANLNYAANQMAWVIQDTTPANNGVYQKTGSSGSGSWARRGNLPYAFYRALNEGAGTPNAIQATNGYPMANKDAIIVVNITDTTTGSPVTISLNGQTPLTIKTSSGNDPAAGGLVAGMVMAGYIDASGTQFRLLSDQASAAIVPAAENAQAAAEAARVDSQNAADAAIGATGIAQFATKAAAEATTLPASTKHLSLAGYSTPGIGPWRVAVRVATQPTHAAKLRTTDRFLPNGSTDSTNGGWWELVADQVSPLQFGATGDGAADDSGAVQDACDYPYASDVFFTAGYVYNINTEIALTSAHNNKRFSGRGTLKQPAAGQHIFNCTSCSGLDFDGLNFRGRLTISSNGSPTTSHNNAITLTTCIDITIQNCFCSRFEFMFLKAWGGRGIKVLNNRIWENAFGGQFTGTRNVVVQGNSFRDCVMYTTTPTVDQFCTVWTCDSTEGHSYGIVTDAAFSDNYVLNAGYSQAFLAHSGSGITYVGNRTVNCTMGISCNAFNSTDSLSNIVIDGNNLTGATSITMPSASDVGINISSSSPSPRVVDVTIVGNVVTSFNRSSLDNGLGGIQIASADTVTVSGNAIQSCAGSGIAAYDVGGITACNNAINTILAAASGRRNGMTFSGNSIGTCTGNSITEADIGLQFVSSNLIVQGLNSARSVTTPMSGTPGGVVIA